jgi:endoglucanase
MHSTVEVVDLDDVEQCIDWLTAFARSIQADDVFSATV